MAFLAQLAGPQVVRPLMIERDDRAGRVRFGGRLEHLAQDRFVERLVAHAAEGESEGMGDEARQ